MPIRAEYLGMGLSVDDLDIENTEYFRHCAEHDFHLQACAQCGQLRYPPTTACPWCASLESVFSDVAPGLALPQWTIDETATQPEKPWRYPQE